MFKGGFQNYKQKEAESLENLRHLIGVLGQLPFILVNWFAKCLFPTSCEFHKVTHFHVYPSFDQHRSKADKEKYLLQAWGYENLYV